MKEPVEIVDFNNTINIIAHDNYLKASMIIENNKALFFIPGYEERPINLMCINNIDTKKLHPSQNLALFSLGFASDYFFKKYRTGTLNENDINILEKVYMNLYKIIINPFSTNRMIVNDHAISERIQFIFVFSSYLNSYYPHKKEVLMALSKDLNICLGFLLDDNYFTWNSNHGIMQLRSIGQISYLLKNKKLQNDLIRLLDRRLKDITPYFIGQDGAVYEAASEYWIFIYNQFRKITDITPLRDLESVKELSHQLSQVEYFLYTVAANDGFLQGLGDSYSFYMDKITANVIKNRYFRFSNELAGANWSNDKYNYNILFVSLHTPPNAHKLPEDLMLSLYINKPFFVNTGTFSYDNSNSRRYFVFNEQGHSTIMFKNNQNTVPNSSKIYCWKAENNNSLRITGIKQYSTGKMITREIEIIPGAGINIKDYSNTNEMLVSYFNIHPDICITKYKNNEITLKNRDLVAIKMISNAAIKITEGVISDSKEHLIKIKRLRIEGPCLTTEIYFNQKPNINEPINQITGVMMNNQRNIISAQLSKKYKKPKSMSNKLIIIKKIQFLLMLFLAFVLFFEIAFYVYKKVNKFNKASNYE